MLGISTNLVKNFKVKVLWVVKFFTNFFIYILNTLYFMLKLVAKVLSFSIYTTYNILYKVTIPIHNSIIKIFIYFLNKLLFFFITIPWFMYGEFFKPLFMKYFFSKTMYFWKKIEHFFKLRGVVKLVTHFLKRLLSLVTQLYWVLWKCTIDFVFFKILRNKKKIFFTFYRLYSVGVYFILLYFIFYLNFLGKLHGFFFFYKIEDFAVLDTGSFWGCVNIIISLFNINYVFLYLYTFFNSVGFFKFFFCENFNLIFGCHWVQNFTKFNLFSEDSSMFGYLLCYLNEIFFEKSNFFDRETPIFFFFGFFFFITVVLSWLFFNYLGVYGIFKINFIALLIFWLSLLFSAKGIFIDHAVYVVKLCSWVFLSVGVRIDYYFLFDTISFSFILLTTTIALFVFVYAFSYFRYEPLVDRFLLFLLSFVVSMLFLVSSGNTIMLFLGWELIGLTSFFLINFWTTKTATLKSAFKAFTFNKVSDFFLFMFLITTSSLFYTFDILSLNNQVYFYEFVSLVFFKTNISFIELLTLLLLGAAFIKSAQIGGHAWLPDSMEAPVPASALIHSATLVSAGIYLILRFNSFFDVTQYSKYLIPIFGSITAAYGGVCAVAQSDIKKTLAYSTISHCGFLMVLCATEMNEFTMLYLYAHGFFKAGVFMCIGNVLRISRGYQDTRRMGGLLKYLPFEYFCSVVGLLNLAGLPFTFGFFVKHLLLISVNNNMYIYYFILINSLVGAVAGIIYSYKLVTNIFVDFKKGPKSLYLSLNRGCYNSIYYTNSSLSATIAIFFLFFSAYCILYFLFKSFLCSSFLFSDCLNTTITTNYFSMTDCSYGFLINFSYLNLFVIIITSYLFFFDCRFTHLHTRKIKLIGLVITIMLYFLLFNLL